MKNSKELNISLWVAQVLISQVLLLAGFMKFLTPIAELSKNLPWADDVPAIIVKALALFDIAGGLGIFLPSVLKIKPQLTPLAAKAIILLMISATAFHLSRGEASLTVYNFIIILLAVFVAWCRTKKMPILAKA